MTPKTLYVASAALGCIGLLSLVAGGALTFGGLAARAKGGGDGARPTQADIEAAVRESWERPADSPPTSVELHAIEIGDSNPANEQDLVDGIPPGADVTAALVDFTVRTHYDDQTQAVRRRMEAKVYVDAFGQWRVMNDGSRGDDVLTREPPTR